MKSKAFAASLGKGDLKGLTARGSAIGKLPSTSKTSNHRRDGDPGIRKSATEYSSVALNKLHPLHMTALTRWGLLDCDTEVRRTATREMKRADNVPQQAFFESGTTIESKFVKLSPACRIESSGINVSLRSDVSRFFSSNCMSYSATALE